MSSAISLYIFFATVLVLILVGVLFTKGERKSSYAGFWSRVVAWSVDLLIIGVIFGVLYAMLRLFFPESERVVAFGLERSTAETSTIVLAVYWLYFALFESSSRRATPGKMLAGIQVTDTKDRRISFYRATARYFLKYLFFMMMFRHSLIIGYILMISGFGTFFFTEKKQALHDILTGCLVVNK